MNGNNPTVSSVKGFSTLVRPKFGPGMLLQHDDLEQLSDYTRDLSRLLFRSFFGCGVVCGLCVKVQGQCGKMMVTVSPGLALDCTGDPIYVPKEQSLPIEDDCSGNQQGPLWVLLCGTTKCCSPRASMCSTDDDQAQSACTRERDCFEIRLVSGELPPKCVCACGQQTKKMEKLGLGGTDATPLPPERDCQCADPNDPCYVDHYQGVCGCGCKDSDGTDCCGDCVLLAKLTKGGQPDKVEWVPDHTVRRFVRPVLVRDQGCKASAGPTMNTTTPEPPPSVADGSNAATPKKTKSTKPQE